MYAADVIKMHSHLDPIVLLHPVAVRLEDTGGGRGRIACVDVDGIQLTEDGECTVLGDSTGQREVTTCGVHCGHVHIAELGKVTFAELADAGFT